MSENKGLLPEWEVFVFSGLPLTISVPVKLCNTSINWDNVARVVVFSPLMSRIQIPVSEICYLMWLLPSPLFVAALYLWSISSLTTSLCASQVVPYCLFHLLSLLSEVLKEQQSVSLICIWHCDWCSQFY